MSYNYIAVEGNIGAGKTSLCMRLSRDLNAGLLLEQFEDNPFLPKFYADPRRFAFPLEMSFLADRFTQLKAQLAEPDLSKNSIVSDYVFFKCLVFSKITLDEDEFAIYKKMFDILNSQLPVPDLLLFLYRHPEQLLSHIKKRGRSFEQQIEVNYLEQIQKEYLDLISKQKEMRILLLNAAGLDFLDSDEDYLKVKALLQKDFSPGVHNIQL